MAISISKLGVTKNRTATIPVFDGEVTVTFDATKLSSASINQITQSIEEDDFTGAARLFVSIVSEWDLAGPIGEGKLAVKDGEVIPLTPEHVAFIPVSILNYILEAIIEQTNPKSAKKRT